MVTRFLFQGWNFLGGLAERPALRLAGLLWGVVALVVFVLVAVEPNRHTATIEYQKAALRWWDSDNLYKGKNNYLYLPQAAMLYTPFKMLPKRVGEPLWRMVCLGTLAFALGMAARHLAPDRAGAVFFAASVLVLPSALASARNGQVNMPLAGLYLLTALCLARERWWLTALLLALSLALKPISIVPILLCGVLFPRLVLPLLLSLVVLFAAAWLHPDPKYVSWQYELFWAKLTGSSANPTGRTWSDFAGMLHEFGISLSQPVQMGIRAGAAVGTFGVCLLAVWKTSDPLRRAMTVLLFAAIYLMLFNPRTEANSYVIFGIFVALLAAWEGLVTRRRAAFAAWLAVALLLGTENYGGWIYRSTNLWLKPLVALGTGLWLAVRVIRMPRGGAAIFLPAHRHHDAQDVPEEQRNGGEEGK